MAVVEFETRDAVAIVTLNRPERLNAMDAEMAVRLIDVFAEIRASETIHVAIITGAGTRAFCAGGDLGSVIPVMTGDRAASSEWERRWMEVRGTGGPFKTDIGKPLIAAVNGHAAAGGMELVLNTDIRIAVPQATFSIPEVKLGLFPGGGSTVRLPAQVPFAHAMHALLTGEAITADDALRFGLINAIAAPGGLLAKAMEIAARIASNAPLAVQAVRESVRACYGFPEPQALGIEQEFSRRIHATQDAVEGPRAFLEKRPPQFQGR